jgi:hypothetical protein
MSKEVEDQMFAEQESASAALAELEQDIVQGRPDSTDDDLPDKFKGKTKAEIAKSYTELESLNGRQASEYGQLKRMSDELLNLKKQKAEPEVSVDVDTLLDDPSKTINSVVDKNERLMRIERQLQQDSLAKAKGRFEEKHPDWSEVMGNQDFQNWINSSQVRQSMFEAADKQYNYDVGDELFTLYKEGRQAKAQESEQNRNNRIKGNLNDAATETGVSGTKSAKVYKRTDLINLRVYQPEKYEAMQEDIRKAYEEGRVR